MPSLQHTKHFVCRWASWCPSPATPALLRCQHSPPAACSPFQPVPAGAAAVRLLPWRCVTRGRDGAEETGPGGDSRLPSGAGGAAPFTHWLRGGAARTPPPSSSPRRLPTPPPAAGLSSCTRLCLPMALRLVVKETSGCGYCRSGVAVGRPWWALPVPCCRWTGTEGRLVDARGPRLP